jgi:type VI secretion system secreted protein VgrG
MPEPLLPQSQRSIAIQTPLGDDVLAIQAVHGTEELGRLFQYEIDLLGTTDTLNFGELLGQNVTIRLGVGEDGPDVRYINGYVSRVSQHDYRSGYAVYRASIVPWLWFLTRQSDCAIYQNLSIPDIIKKVFKDLGFTDIDDKLSGSYEARDYCVQYRETTFNFVQRLMEQEGIYYYFAHENGKHTLVLCDGHDSHPELANGAEIPFYPPDHAIRGEQHIRMWTVSKQIQSLEYELADFDFVNPASPVVAKARKARDHANGPWEAMYDYPGEYVTPAEAEAYATIRLQELQARYEQTIGQSDHLGMHVGGRFTLTLPIGGLRDDQAREYILVSTSIQASQDLFASGSDGGDQLYSIGFSVIPAEEVFRPARVTPKPIVQGPQTAVVVGKSGEEIWTDEYGRVKLQFHWDRYSPGDENSSCWVRVSQNWAGKRWGAFFMPRIGHEVIVEFLEGDPDRPIIIGRVYNGQNMPPYEPKSMGTISTMKSNSSKGGAGFNEIRFEDKKDDEQFFLHAQKNMDIRVLNDRFETIMNNRHLVVEKDKFEHVKNNRHETVDADHKETIKKDRHLHVEGNDSTTVVGEQTLIVKSDVHEVCEANVSAEVTEQWSLTADTAVIECATNITLKVGDSYIAIQSDGIKIATNGQIVLEANGDIGVTSKTGAVNLEASAGDLSAKGGIGITLEGTATGELKAAKVTVNGSAQTEVKGGVVMIN